MLAGVLRSTAALCVILLEVTNNLTLLPAIMLVNLVAKFVGDSTGVLGLFERSMGQKGLPFLEQAPERHYRHLTGELQPLYYLPF
jgi:chloride channel 7